MDSVHPFADRTLPERKPKTLFLCTPYLPMNSNAVAVTTPCSGCDSVILEARAFADADIFARASGPKDVGLFACKTAMAFSRCSGDIRRPFLDARIFSMVSWLILRPVHAALILARASIECLYPVLPFLAVLMRALVSSECVKPDDPPPPSVLLAKFSKPYAAIIATSKALAWSNVSPSWMISTVKP